MKRLAAIFVVAAAVSGATPLTATAAAPSGKTLCTVTGVWPLTIVNMPYCE